MLIAYTYPNPPFPVGIIWQSDGINAVINFQMSITRPDGKAGRGSAFGFVQKIEMIFVAKI